MVAKDHPDYTDSVFIFGLLLPRSTGDGMVALRRAKQIADEEARAKAEALRRMNQSLVATPGTRTAPSVAKKS